MLIIRFSRVGKKNHAQYKVVLTEKTSPVKGRFVEILGSYNPHQKTSVLKDERIKYWIGQGVGCSDTAWNLLVAKGIVGGKKRSVKIQKPVKEATAEATEAVGETKPAEEK